MKKGVVLHHSAIKSGWSDPEGLNLAQVATDPETLKKNGVMSPAEYNFIVPKSGKYFPLISSDGVWGHPSRFLSGDFDKTVGHCNSRVYNPITFGVCCDGYYHFENDSPAETMPATQLQGIVACVSFLFWYAGIKHVTDTIGTDKAGNMVQALTKHTIVGDQYTACPGNRFPFDEIFKACAMALRPSQIVFMLDNPTVGERMSHLPQNNRVTLSQAPFISDDSVQFIQNHITILRELKKV
jgi:hypothetical protein